MVTTEALLKPEAVSYSGGVDRDFLFAGLGMVFINMFLHPCVVLLLFEANGYRVKRGFLNVLITPSNC